MGLRETDMFVRHSCFQMQHYGITTRPLLQFNSKKKVLINYHGHTLFVVLDLPISITLKKERPSSMVLPQTENLLPKYLKLGSSNNDNKRTEFSVFPPIFWGKQNSMYDKTQ